jgi:RND family efflux transporter MFP subunit
VGAEPRGAPAAALAFALAFGGALASAGCRRQVGDGEPGPERRAVRCAPVALAEVDDAIELRGTVAPLPDRDAQVAPQVPGRIVAVTVREGDTVTAGQAVARIDDAPLVDQANEADAILAKTQAERRNAEATRARTERVFEHGIAARQEVDDAATRADTARAAETEAAAAAKRARRQVDRATVRSPLAGVVVRILRRTGELVDGTPATPVVEVADPSRLELVSDAAASDLVRVAPGARAEITVAALPGAAWTGAVSAVSPAVDRATGLGVVRMAIALGGAGRGDGGAATRPPIGVLGTARVIAGRPRKAPVVPREALRSGAGAEAEVVVCGADGAARVRRVRRGATAGAAVEVDGVAPGDAVALDPVGIVDGAPLEIEHK